MIKILEKFFGNNDEQKLEINPSNLLFLIDVKLQEKSKYLIDNNLEENSIDQFIKDSFGLSSDASLVAWQNTVVNILPKTNFDLQNTDKLPKIIEIIKFEFYKKLKENLGSANKSDEILRKIIEELFESFVNPIPKKEE